MTRVTSWQSTVEEIAGYDYSRLLHINFERSPSAVRSQHPHANWSLGTAVTAAEDMPLGEVIAWIPIGTPHAVVEKAETEPLRRVWGELVIKRVRFHFP